MKRSDKRSTVSETVSSIRERVLEVSDFIYGNPELSSEEYKGCKHLVDALRGCNASVTENYLGMETSFMAKHGSGRPRICLFAEYDALPSGHACGHNIIAGWALGTFLTVASMGKFKGTLYLFGSPAEEGRGRYASSKVKISKELRRIGMDAAFVIHPGDSWAVFGGYYARWRKSFTFMGKESHAAGAPEDGINALDAGVSFYQAVRSLRSALPADKQIIVSSIIKDGGTAVNIIPGRAEVWVDIRAVDKDLLLHTGRRVDRMASGIASANGCGLVAQSLAPVTGSFKRNEKLDNLLLDSGTAFIDELYLVGEAERRPLGSSDVGNVSSVVPTSQLIVKIANSGTPLHSRDFLEAAGSERAKEAMLMSIRASSLAILNLGDG